MNPQHLRAKSELLDQLRDFFHSRGFTEVATPIASSEVIPERHIELFQTSAGDYLQASPEMAMKQLLCRGAGPIFQIGAAFRAEERGPLHAPEFTMVEWYRPGHDMQGGLDLLDELSQVTLAPLPCKRTSYRQAFLDHVGCDPFDPTAVRDAAALMAEAEGLTPEHSPPDTDDLLNLLLAKKVEPNLGAERPEILYHFPASQSALSETAVDEAGHAVAERFELYFHGVELANGYHELTDPAVLRERLTLANQQREADGRQPLPLPERLFTQMTDLGLPPCAGVALGFDRLLMLRLGVESIEEVT